ncbi:MAG: response regulator transcription factor [Anaerolineae bacterium]|nr:response regulator transcription factor [Anaerolineae bacterium]
MNRPLRTLVADNNTLTFYGLPQILDEGQYVLLPDFARSYQEAYDYCREHMPDVLVLAGQLTRPYPEAVIGRFRQEFPTMRIVYVDDSDNDALDNRLMSLGVAGFLRHDAPLAAWERCFRVIADGGVYRREFQPDNSPPNPTTLTELSTRERDLLQCIQKGLNNREIGIQMGLSEATVRNCLTALYTKLGVSGRTQAALWALQAGIQGTDEDSDDFELGNP